MSPRSRLSSSIQIGLLLILSAVLASDLGSNDPSSAFQSPLSPLQSVILYPQPASPEQLSAPARQPSRWLAPSLWASPLPWIVVGLIVFGGLAGVLYVVLRHYESMAERE